MAPKSDKPTGMHPVEEEHRLGGQQKDELQEEDLLCPFVRAKQLLV
jgi:hypothetical protein